MYVHKCTKCAHLRIVQLCTLKYFLWVLYTCTCTCALCNICSYIFVYVLCLSVCMWNKAKGLLPVSPSCSHFFGGIVAIILVTLVQQEKALLKRHVNWKTTWKSWEKHISGVIEEKSRTLLLIKKYLWISLRSDPRMSLRNGLSEPFL